MQAGKLPGTPLKSHALQPQASGPARRVHCPRLPEPWLTRCTQPSPTQGCREDTEQGPEGRLGGRSLTLSQGLGTTAAAPSPAAWPDPDPWEAGLAGEFPSSVCLKEMTFPNRGQEGVGPQGRACSQVTCLATQRATTGHISLVAALHTPREGWLTRLNHTSKGSPLGRQEARPAADEGRVDHMTSWIYGHRDKVTRLACLPTKALGLREALGAE